MTDTFTLDWPHGWRTHDGRKARIICTDRKSGWPIIGLTTNADGTESVDSFRLDGHFDKDTETPSDLVNAPAPKLSGTVWVNVREHDEYVGVGHAYVSREMADRGGDDDDRLACVEVHWTEGEGL